MFRIFQIALMIAFCTLASGAAGAGPLTFYYSEASWLAAFPGSIGSGSPVGSLGGPGNITTVETDSEGTCCNILGSSPTGFGNVSNWDFDQVGEAFDQFCVSLPADNCTVSAPSDFTVSFGEIVGGLVSLDASYLPLDPDGMINGQPIGDVFDGFFGIAGPFTQLYFSGCLLCDNQSDIISLNDLIIVPADEPRSLADIAVALVLLVPPFIARRFTPKYAGH